MTEFQYLNQGNSEAQDRLATSFLLQQSSTGLAKTGILSGLTVSQTPTASAAVLIAAGAGNSQDTVSNGAALMVNDTQKTLDILTGNPVGGTPRNDIVVFDSATTSIRALIGIPNASPTDPTIPATAIPLARIRNAASATTIPSTAIDDLRTTIYLAGVSSTLASPFISVAQTVTSTPPTQNVWTILGWNSVVENDGFTYSGGVFTAPVAGVYAITVQYTFTSSSPVVQIGAALADNSTPPVPYRRAFTSSMTGANAAVGLTVEYRLAAGQQFTLPVITAASGHGLEVSTAGTFATVRWVRP